jgi:hypothetical protein
MPQVSSSADRLETCVVCEKCGRFYHIDTSYPAPKLPNGFEFRDAYVGELGRGRLLRFSRGEDEQDRILVEFDECSTPESKCTGRLLKSVALALISQHRTGKEVPGVCFTHAHDRDALRDIAIAKAQSDRNGNGHRNDEELQQFLVAVSAAAVVWDVVKGSKGTFEHRVKKIDLLDIGDALDVPIDTFDDPKSRNRIIRKLKNLGVYKVYPSDKGGAAAFVEAVAKEIEGGASREEAARLLWNQRSV